MTKEEQIRFIKELSENVVNEMIHDIEKNDGIPETWDGIELRWWLADRFDRSVLKGTRNKRRKQAYENEVIVRDL